MFILCRVLQAPGDSQLAIVPVSVVKDDAVQGVGGTNRVQREISILWLPAGLFGKSISVGLYVWKCDTATSASQQVKVKLSLESSSKLSALGMCTNLFTEIILEYCIRDLFFGGDGGDSLYFWHNGTGQMSSSFLLNCAGVLGQHIDYATLSKPSLIGCLIAFCSLSKSCFVKSQ